MSYRVCFFFVFFLNTELLWRRLWWLLTFPTGALVGVRQQQGRRTTDGVLRPSTLRSASTTLIRSFVFFYLFFLRHPFQPVSRFVHSCFLVFYFVFLFIFLGGWKAKERRTINKRTDGNKSSRLNGQLIATSEARLKEAAKEENTHREREREREREKRKMVGMKNGPPGGQCRPCGPTALHPIAILDLQHHQLDLIAYYGCVPSTASTT